MATSYPLIPISRLVYLGHKSIQVHHMPTCQTNSKSCTENNEVISINSTCQHRYSIRILNPRFGTSIHNTFQNIGNLPSEQRRCPDNTITFLTHANYHKTFIIIQPEPNISSHYAKGDNKQFQFETKGKSK